ncbi:hypothetical protein CMK11_06735 [Candidatus Poribacteria bacterium]|nr:hypothetical protein [Candidatus Poribacteria bacterium]
MALSRGKAEEVLGGMDRAMRHGWSDRARRKQARSSGRRHAYAQRGAISADTSDALREVTPFRG